MSKVYLRPTGLVHGSEARSLIQSGLGLSLAGGFSAFSMIAAAASIEVVLISGIGL